MEAMHDVESSIALLGVELPDFIAVEVEAGEIAGAGGNIKNIVLNASFMAASEEQCIYMKHLILAARREFQKMGKACTKAVFGEYMSLIED